MSDILEAIVEISKVLMIGFLGIWGLMLLIFIVMTAATYVLKLIDKDFKEGKKDE